MAYETVLDAVDDGVATITLNRTGRSSTDIPAS